MVSRIGPLDKRRVPVTVGHMGAQGIVPTVCVRALGGFRITGLQRTAGSSAGPPSRSDENIV